MNFPAKKSCFLFFTSKAFFFFFQTLVQFCVTAVTFSCVIRLGSDTVGNVKCQPTHILKRKKEKKVGKKLKGKGHGDLQCSFRLSHVWQKSSSNLLYGWRRQSCGWLHILNFEKDNDWARATVNFPPRGLHFLREGSLQEEAMVEVNSVVYSLYHINCNMPLCWQARMPHS